MAIKLSFIIPVYNVEQYIEECVNSILGQAGEEVEIILVDDGSTDGSGVICDRFAQEYVNVTVIHQENQGHSAARNAGLDASSGEYVMFVDSDDYIAENCVGVILDYITSGGCDICFMEAVKVFPDGMVMDLGDRIERSCIKGRNKAEVMQYLSTRPKFPGGAWSKVFKKRFLQDRAIRFPTNLLHGEDLTLCMEAILAADTFDALNVPYYYYRQNRQGSVTASAGLTAFSDLSCFVRSYADMLAPDKMQRDDVSGYAMAFVAYEYSILLWKYSLLPKEEKKRAFEFLKAYRWVMRYSPAMRIRCINLASTAVGLRLTSGLLNTYMTHRK